MRKFKLLISTTLIVAAFGLIAVNMPANEVTAQSGQDTFGQLISDLWTRVLENQTSEQASSFNFTISFISAIPGLGNSINFGQAINTSRIERTGEDYVCIAKVFSRNMNIDCVPYTNISKVSYQENPS